MHSGSQTPDCQKQPGTLIATAVHTPIGPRGRQISKSENATRPDYATTTASATAPDTLITAASLPKAPSPAFTLDEREDDHISNTTSGDDDKSDIYPMQFWGETKGATSGSPGKTKSGRKWNKRHSCLFCKMYVIKMARHLERKHADEVDVARILAMKSGSES